MYPFNDRDNERQYEEWHRYGRDRGFFDRMGDEIRSWFGDEDAERRRQEDMRMGRINDSGYRSESGRGTRAQRPEWQRRDYSGASPRGSYIEEQGRYDEPQRMSRRGLRRGWGQEMGRGGMGRMNRWNENELGRGYGREDYENVGRYNEGLGRYGESYASGYQEDHPYGGRSPRFFDEERQENLGYGGGMGYGVSRFGREDRERGGLLGHRGRGPRNYQRSDERISDEIHQYLTFHPELDATDIDVLVENGIVTLRGAVDSRSAKRLAEDIVEDVYGVKEVHNELRVNRGDFQSNLNNQENLGRNRISSR